MIFNNFINLQKPWCLQPLHIAWYNLLRANSDVHEHILLYKPIDLTHLKTFYKSIEMNFDNKVSTSHSHTSAKIQTSRKYNSLFIH